MSTDGALGTQVSDDRDQPGQTSNIGRRRDAVRGELRSLEARQPGAVRHAARRQVTGKLFKTHLAQTLQQTVSALSRLPAHLPPLVTVDRYRLY